MHKPQGPPEWALIVISTGVARLWGQKRTLERGFYVNDFYSNVIVAPAKAGSAFLAYVFDARVIDGAVNGLGRVFRGLAGAGRRVQTGLVRNYALALLAGAVGILSYLAVKF